MQTIASNSRTHIHFLHMHQQSCVTQKLLDAVGFAVVVLVDMTRRHCVAKFLLVRTVWRREWSCIDCQLVDPARSCRSLGEELLLSAAAGLGRRWSTETAAARLRCVGCHAT